MKFKQLYILCMLLILPLSKALATPQEDFFNTLLPAVKKAHHIVMAQRHHLTEIHQRFQKKEPLSKSDRQYVLNLSKSYSVSKMDLSKEKDWQVLFSRVDVIPTSMVLAQAADESAWGRSRFARLGYNYFGQWCFTEGCGIVPKRRAKGAHHEVRRFTSREDAIKHYFHNLNTGHAYQKLRALRGSMRRQGKALSGVEIARGLEHYSALGQRYVIDIQHIIKRYHLERFD